MNLSYTGVQVIINITPQKRRTSMNAELEAAIDKNDKVKGSQTTRVAHATPKEVL